MKINTLFLFSIIIFTNTQQTYTIEDFDPIRAPVLIINLDDPFENRWVEKETR